MSNSKRLSFWGYGIGIGLGMIGIIFSLGFFSPGFTWEKFAIVWECDLNRTESKELYQSNIDVENYTCPEKPSISIVIPLN